MQSTLLPGLIFNSTCASTCLFCPHSHVFVVLPLIADLPNYEYPFSLGACDCILQPQWHTYQHAPSVPVSTLVSTSCVTNKNKDSKARKLFHLYRRLLRLQTAVASDEQRTDTTDVPICCWKTACSRRSSGQCCTHATDASGRRSAISAISVLLCLSRGFHQHILRVKTRAFSRS